jgi:hypothetical protein
MPSGRLDRTTPASCDTLTPPWRTVRPSTNDSGIPSRTEPEHDRQRRPVRLGALRVLALAAAAAGQQPIPDGEDGRADQDQQRHPGDGLGLERLVDQLEGH